MSQILVIGGAGYIGAHVVHALLSEGYSPIVLDDLSSGHAEFVPAESLVVADMADTEQLLHLLQTHQIDTVMNFAGLITVEESVKEPQKYYQTNVIKTTEMINALIQSGVSRFIFSSSCAVYGSPQFLPLTEEHPLNPESPYGTNKLVIEHLLSDYARVHSAFHYISLRYFNAAGASDTHRIGEWHEPESHLIPLIFEASEEDPLIIYGTDYKTPDGTCVRDYIHVLDIAKAHLLALKYLQEHQKSRVFNLGNGKGFSVKEMIAQAELCMGRKVPVGYGAPRIGDPAVLVGSSQRAHQELGWAAQHSSIQNILKSAWKWHQYCQAMKSD